ncbi:rho guanine nucleotide exchange factor 2 isoform X1 [Osmerus mordax]|uniref:rho guanine nucleotide exchange factor 2 isoform X1 n=1 Tax=Osmerus mordax TaxID=8014 RepID=UPI00350EB127
MAGWRQNRQRSMSLEDLDPEEMEKVLFGALGGPVSRGGRDLRRTPITAFGQRLDNLLSLTEEEASSESQLFSSLEESHLQGFTASAPSLCASLSQLQLSNTSLHPHTHPQHHQHDQQQQRHRSSSNASSYSSNNHHYQESSLTSKFGGSTQSVDAELGELYTREKTECPGGEREWKRRGEERRTEGARGVPPGEDKGEKTSSLGRTFSFLLKMAGPRKNKEKERMKEREKEARDREARYSNGHLFTSLTVSATTLCSACNKSITAKEALSCPTCNVTIHNRCRDTLANCAKMKQRQQKLALVRNSTALQNVALRTKTPMMKERPSSAIYPSDSIRQSLLGARRVRSGLSLSKSVSTTNIAGNLNDDSPLGLRRILSQSTDSLNFRNRAMSMESLNDEGEVYYAAMLEELEREGKDFEADSWSRAVDSSYLQTHRKDVIKRQDVIYELIQTEFHHVRTLRIMEGVFRQGMLEEVLLEPGVVHAVFPCLDQLLALHTRFLAQLLARRTHSLAPGSTTNSTIHQLGDVLTEQFSGQCADEMRKAYAEFCSRHPKAVKLYKELLARDKRFQHFIRRASRGPLLRRHGVQECILLVTQRITKYPVLIQRILDNTKGSEEEAQSISCALTLLRELLSSVDQQVLELERTQRLQEVRARLDPRAQAEVRGGGVFRGGELLRRRLLHEGTLLWKTQGSRLKDVQVLLMTDILVFLQEKDQKFIFPCLDKPAVVSLKNLIVRDIANQERGMFLISDSTPPEMYELHAASKDDRKNWMKLIQQTVCSCPSREDFPLIETEDKALLRRLRADIQQKDREVLELLQERVTLFSDLAEVTGCGQEAAPPNNSRNMFRADTPYAPQAECLLTDAISEVDRLSELLLGSNIELPQSSSTNGTSSTNSDQNHTGAPVSNGDSISINGTHETNGSPSPKDRNGNQLQDRSLNEEVCQRLVNVSAQLHALQAAVIRQDSILELCPREGLASSAPPTPTPAYAPAPLHPVAKLNRSMSRDTGLDAGTTAAAAAAAIDDVAMLQRQNAFLQEELVRLRPLEARLRESERARALLEQQLREAQGRRGSRGSNGDIGDVMVSEQALPKRRGSADGESGPVAPLACQEPVDQLDGVQEGSEEESDEEPDVVRISPRSDSPRDLQDIPEEAECGPEARESEADTETVQS